MDLEAWIIALHAKIDPTGRTSPERAVMYLRPRLGDLSPEWFTHDAIDALFIKLRSLNSADRVRKELRDFHGQHTPPRPPPSQQERDALAWEERQAWLRADWDDADGIVQRMRACRGNVLLLRLLAKLVRHWAPQHLGHLPPHIIAAIDDDDADIAPQDRHLRFDDDTPPPGTRSVAEQLHELGASDRPPPPRPMHLSPAILDQINPLPHGRKRHVPANDTAAPPVDPDAA